MDSELAAKAEPCGPPDAALAALASRIGHAAGPGKRYVLGIAGSPGGGKTTFAKALVAHLNARTHGMAAYVPMDGFHLANSVLDRRGLRDRKGAIETFDGWGFLALVERMRVETDHTLYAPSFDRTIDEGVAGEMAVEPEAHVVVVEGNYLLAEAEPWARLRRILDATWFCSTPTEVREARLIDRHTRHGRTKEAAAAWTRDVDGVNAALIEAGRDRADLMFCGVTGEILSTRFQ